MVIYIRIRGFFGRNFTVAKLALVKAADCGFGSGGKIHGLVDLRLNEVKAALAELCTDQVLILL